MDVLNEEAGRLAVVVARSALRKMAGRETEPLPALPPVFEEHRGVFVTLNRDGELRGCIGFPYPVMPLAEALSKAAVAAAREDPRFRPVAPDEVDRITLEVTVLSVPQPLTCEPADRPDHVVVGTHGIIITGHQTGGLLLPQVATEYGWDAITFLDHTCMKAGLPPGCWQSAETEVLIFEGQVFPEQVQ
jgi:uncharacterized protein (TIGR00296 family)